MKYTEEDYVFDKLAGRLKEALDESKPRSFLKHLIGVNFTPAEGEILIEYINARTRLPKYETFEEWKQRKEQE